MATRRSVTRAIAGWAIAALVAAAPLPAAAATQPVSPLAARIDHLLDAPPFDRVTWGVLLCDSTGRTLYTRDADRLLVPASNHKLLVTTAALALLGPDRRVTTRVFGGGPVDDGVLRGDLVVAGAGDPGFSSHCYGLGSGECDSVWTGIDALVDGLVARGLRRVEGAIVGDGSAFEPELVHPGWDAYDLNWWYAAPVSALGFNDDCVDITWRPGPLGAPATVSFAPELGAFTFENRSRTAAPGTTRTLDFFRTPGSWSVWADGAVPLDDPGNTEYFAMPDPNRYFALALRRRLERRGIAILGPTESTTDSLRYRDARRGAPLATRTSRSVGDLVFPILNTSQNWFAEMLLKLLGRLAGGGGSWSEGLRVERRFLVERVGIDSTAFDAEDGSGLAAGNLVSPRALTQILDYAAHHRGGAAFMRALPHAGGPGSLHRRFVGTPLAGRVIAKPGNIDRVHSLSGFIDPPGGGERRTFSIIANGWSGAAAPMLARIDSVVVEMSR